MIPYRKGRGRMKEQRGVVWGLLAGLLVTVLCRGGEETILAGAEKVWAGQGEYRLVTGLPDENFILLDPAKEKDTGYLAQVDESHPAAEESGCSLRGMVGSFLPVEGDIFLRPEVIYALCDMQMERKLEDGCLFIRGYVEKEAQNVWHEEALERYGRVGKTACEAGAKVPSGGCSDHQLGLAVDMKLTGKLNMGRKDPLLRNETGRWLKENMHRFGFVYREDYSHCEAIHLRYVGKQHAQWMHWLDTNGQDYVELLRTEKGLLLMEGEQLAGSVQWVEQGQMARIPRGMAVQVSRDNRGNWIVWAGKE